MKNLQNPITRAGGNDICDAMNRNNPDRSIVGEIRGGEIVAASEIAESKSGGFMTTVHACGVNILVKQKGELPAATWILGATVVVVLAIVAAMTFFPQTMQTVWDQITQYIVNMFGIA